MCEGEQGISNGQVVFEFVRGAHGVFALGAPCIENRGIEDNFIFYIECYFFFCVRKYKCEWRIFIC